MTNTSLKAKKIKYKEKAFVIIVHEYGDLKILFIVFSIVI